MKNPLLLAFWGPAGRRLTPKPGDRRSVRWRTGNSWRIQGGGDAVAPASGLYRLTHLRALEAEAIHIFREVAAEFERPVLLFSGGKDSVVMLHLAGKAFWPAPLPFPVMHVDTGHNFPEVIEFRDRHAAELGVRLLVASVQDDIDAGPGGRGDRAAASRNRLQTVTLLDAIAEHRFDAVFGGARRDEEKARAKERVFSFRDEFGQWDPRTSAPSCGTCTTAATARASTSGSSPSPTGPSSTSGSTSSRSRSSSRRIYYAHQREVFERDGMLLAVSPFVTCSPRDEEVFETTVRFRTVGDADLHRVRRVGGRHRRGGDRRGRRPRLTERGATRADDRISEAGMEDRKREGYF